MALRMFFCCLATLLHLATFRRSWYNELPKESGMQAAETFSSFPGLCGSGTHSTNQENV